MYVKSIVNQSTHAIKIYSFSIIIKNKSNIIYARWSFSKKKKNTYIKITILSRQRVKYLYNK